MEKLIITNEKINHKTKGEINMEKKAYALVETWESNIHINYADEVKEAIEYYIHQYAIEDDNFNDSETLEDVYDVLSLHGYASQFVSLVGSKEELDIKKQSK